MKIEFCEDGSCWIEIKTSRLKWFPKNHEATKAARNGLILDGLARTKRAFAEGNHEPVVYYRDEEGKVCIPPDNTVPKQYERLEIRSLREADIISKEMTSDLQGRFSYDITPLLDSLHADSSGRLPRDVIVQEMEHCTSYGREVCREMLEALDSEERDRGRVNANVFFHWRENG